MRVLVVMVIVCVATLTHVVRDTRPAGPRTVAVNWTWTSTSNMPASRRGQLAAVRPNGQVVIIGGVDPSESHPFRRWEASFDVYEPDAQQWKPRREIQRPEVNLNPRDPQRLIAFPNGEPFFATYWADPRAPAVSPQDPARIYSLEEDTWSEIALTSLVGEVLGPTNSLPLMLAPDSNHLRLIGGMSYSPGAAGGYNYNSVAKVFEFSRITNEWRALESMNTRRSQAAGCIMSDGRMFVTCGMTTDVIDGFPSPEEFHTQLISSELYDPLTGLWGAIAASPRTHMLGTTFALQDSRILVLAGGLTSAVDMYDPGTNAWQHLGDLSRTGINLSVAESSSHQVFIAGGNELHPWLDVLDVPSLTWSRLDLPHGMEYSGTISHLGADRFLVTGSGAVNAAILEASAPKTLLIYLPFAYRYARSP